MSVSQIVGLALEVLVAGIVGILLDRALGNKALVIWLVVCLIGLGWLHWGEIRPLFSKRQSPVVAIPKPPLPTLPSLFDQDFHDHTTVFTLSNMAIDWKDGTILHIKRSVYCDYQAGTQFVGFYIPSGNQFLNSDKTYRVALKLVNFVNPTMEELRKDIGGGEGYRNQITLLKNLKFSGRVFLYHEDELTIVQQGEIIKAYKASNFEVQFRGPDYLMDQVITWHRRFDPSGAEPH